MGQKINLTVTITEEKVSEDCQDSFWYDGDVAYVNLLSGNKLYLEATGEIKLAFEVDGASYKGKKAVDIARDKGLNDEGLNDLSIQDLFANNNWFVVINDDLTIVHSYDEGIKQLLELAHEEQNKEYS
jgi:hypothetical protein